MSEHFAEEILEARGRLEEEEEEEEGCEKAFKQEIKYVYTPITGG